MSWGSSTQAVRGDVVKALTDDLAAVDLSTEAEEQADAVLSVLADLLAVVDDGTHQVTVSIRGHANPGHGLSDTAANETLVISIYQTGESVVAPEPSATTSSPPEASTPPADAGTAPAVTEPAPAADGTTTEALTPPPVPTSPAEPDAPVPDEPTTTGAATAESA